MSYALLSTGATDLSTVSSHPLPCPPQPAYTLAYSGTAVLMNTRPSGFPSSSHLYKDPKACTASLLTSCMTCFASARALVSQCALERFMKCVCSQLCRPTSLDNRSLVFLVCLQTVASASDISDGYQSLEVATPGSQALQVPSCLCLTHRRSVPAPSYKGRTSRTNYDNTGKTREYGCRH